MTSGTKTKKRSAPSRFARWADGGFVTIARVTGGVGNKARPKSTKKPSKVSEQTPSSQPFKHTHTHTHTQPTKEINKFQRPRADEARTESGGRRGTAAKLLDTLAKGEVPVRHAAGLRSQGSPNKGVATPVVSSDDTGGVMEETGNRKAVQAHVERMLDGHSTFDTIEKLRVRMAVDEMLHGGESSRRAAKRTLVAFGLAAEPFLEALLVIDEPKMIAAVFESLSQIESTRILPAIQRLSSAADHEIRLVALRVAQQADSGQARSFLAEATRDKSPEVRRRVISYLSWRKEDPWALAELRLLCDDPETSVKLAAIEALGYVSPHEARALLGRNVAQEKGGRWKRLDVALARLESTVAEKSSEASGPSISRVPDVPRPRDDAVPAPEREPEPPAPERQSEPRSEAQEQSSVPSALMQEGVSTGEVQVDQKKRSRPSVVPETRVNVRSAAGTKSKRGSGGAQKKTPPRQGSEEREDNEGN